MYKYTAKYNTFENETGEGSFVSDEVLNNQQVMDRIQSRLFSTAAFLDVSCVKVS